MNLQEHIRKVLKEETSDETQVIKKLLEITILNDYSDFLCDIIVRHPKDRNVLPGQKPYEEYALVFLFIGGEGSKLGPNTMKRYDRNDEIMNSAWHVVYDYTNITTQIYSRYVKDCNEI